MPQLSQNEIMAQKNFNLDNMVDNLDQENLPTANIIIAGVTGSGKSTLINAVFGQELARTGIGCPITDEIKKYTISEIPVCIWDTVGLEIDQNHTQKSLKDIRNIIAKQTAVSDPFDRIHAVWYCISSGTHRYQGAELEFIKDLHSIGVPFIIVLTQCVRGKDDELFENEIRRINADNGMDDIETIQVLAKDYETVLGSIPSSGLERLVETTTQKLPDFIKSGFIAAQRVDVVQKRIQCEEIIMEYVRSAKAGFRDKVPLINVLTTDRKIIRMFQRIGQMYNVNLGEDNIKKITETSNVDFKNNFSGLINPIYFKYKGRVSKFLGEMQQKDGFRVEEHTFTMSERAARMIAFYGYTFVMSIEDVWGECTEEDLKKLNIMTTRLIGSINKKLDEVRRGQYGKKAQ